MEKVSINIEYWIKNDVCLEVSVLVNGKNLDKKGGVYLEKALKILGYIPDVQGD